MTTPWFEALDIYKATENLTVSSCSIVSLSLQSAQFLSQLEEFSSQYSLGLSALKNLIKTVLIISLLRNIVVKVAKLANGYIQLILPWLLISTKSSHFLSLLSVQPTPSVSFGHNNNIILHNGCNMCLVWGTSGSVCICVA